MSESQMLLKKSMALFSNVCSDVKGLTKANRYQLYHCGMSIAYGQPPFLK